ncbi:hypothetical protein HZB02_03240 [Candidatus Woesearchaeota archaeon]|nr:hypothetical protein [Candidatus Woesearchaeota archaeon]
MKRSVIQIANSTSLVSLPIKWCKAYGVKKGDEVEVSIEGTRVIITTDRGIVTQKAEFSYSDYGILGPRLLYALYKRGVDEIMVHFDGVDVLTQIQEAIRKESVGYEIIKQGPTSCVIKSVTSETDAFETLMKRTLSVLETMATTTLQQLRSNNFSHLKSTAFLEETNNRFTTLMRRHLNKKGYTDASSLGSMYVIVEQLEKIADEYKYICAYFYSQSPTKMKIGDDLLIMLEKVNTLLTLFMEAMNKLQPEKITIIGNTRKDVVDTYYKRVLKPLRPEEIVLLHSIITIAQQIFCLIGPLFIVHAGKLTTRQIENL